VGEISSIAWTDATFNPWWGCVRVSPGCEHCYAETLSARYGHAVWGPSQTTERRFFGDAHWKEPLKWNAKAEQEGVRKRVFCASMADVFEDHPQITSTGSRTKLFDLIEATPYLDWLLLTKRPENIFQFIRANWYMQPRPNLWLGTTAEDQEWADRRVPELVGVAKKFAAVSFVSYEPAIGPVDFSDWTTCDHNMSFDGVDTVPDTTNPNKIWLCQGCGSQGKLLRIVAEPVFFNISPKRDYQIDWVIGGGESGAGARPSELSWYRDVRDQCKDAGVSFFMKQLGSVLGRQHAASGRGESLEDIPSDLHVREFPR